MENIKHKEAIVINFDEMEVCNWRSSHIDADIYEDGTSSLPGIGKKPKEWKLEISSQRPKKETYYSCKKACEKYGIVLWFDIIIVILYSIMFTDND